MIAVVRVRGTVNVDKGIKKTLELLRLFKPNHLALLPVGSKVTLAREGSVCAYAKLPEGKTIDARTQRAMMVDEFHPQTDGTIRLWWD